MKFLIAAAATAALATASAPAAAVTSFIFGFTPSGNQTITLNGNLNISAAQSGWFDSNGDHGAGNANYFVGYGGGLATELRDFFVFDAAPGTTSASIDIGNALGSFGSGVTSVTWTLYDVSTLTQSDINGNITNTQYNGRTDVFDDLGSGTIYGSATVTDPSTTTVHVDLNADGIAAINAAGLAGQEFIFGGALTDSSSATPEPATWALMIGGFGLVGAALRRRVALAV